MAGPLFGLVLLLFGLFARRCLAIDVYVSVDGDDSLDGDTMTTAVRSLSRARDVAPGRGFKNSVIEVGCGTYRMEGPLVLDGDRDTTWRGRDGCMPTISGAIPLSWTKEQGGVLTATLDARNSSLHGPRLFVCGVERRRVRTPTLKWDLPFEPPGTYNEHCDKNLSANCFGFYFEEGDVDPSWDLAKIDEWRVGAYHSFSVSYLEVAEVTNESIHFSQPSFFPFGNEEGSSGKRWFIENIAELPLEPGDWRLSREGSSWRVEYRPFPGESGEAELAVLGGDASKLPSGALLQGRGLQNVTFENLRFAQTAAAYVDDASNPWSPWKFSHAVYISESTGISFQRCVVDQTAFGVYLQDCSFCRVEKSALLRSTGSALSVHGFKNGSFDDSFVVGFGSVFSGAAGVNWQLAPGSSMTRNDISFGDHNGFELNSIDDTSAGAVLAYNSVHDNGREDDSGTSDYGAFHSGSMGAHQHWELHHNVFANITAYSHGGAGMYFDLSSVGFHAHHNLVYNVSGALLQWNTKAGSPLQLNSTSVVEDNVFIHDRVWPGHPDPIITWNGYSPSKFQRNIVVVANARPVLFQGTTCAQVMGASQDCTDRLVDNFKLAKFNSNIYFNTSGNMTETWPGPRGGSKNVIQPVPGTATWEDWLKSGHDVDSLLDTDPRFLDAPRRDYRLQDDSPARKLGIQDLDLSHVGPTWNLVELVGEPLATLILRTQANA